MKGETTIELGGEEIKLRFDFGAVEDFCEEMGIDFSDWQEEVFKSPKNIRLLAFFMAKDHNEVESDDFRRMMFSDIKAITGLITSSTDGLEQAVGNGLGEAEK